MTNFETYVLLMCGLLVVIVATASGIAATLYPMPSNYDDERQLEEVFFEIDDRVKNDATLYWLLEKYCQDAFSGFIWMRFSNAKQASAVARITIAMSQENTRRYNKVIEKRNRDINSFKKVSRSLEDIEKEFSQLKLRCFDTDAGHNFSNLITQQGINVEWVVESDERWGARFVLRATNYPLHTLGHL